MKNIVKQLVIATIIATVFSSCETTAEDILKKYDSYGQLQIDADKAPIYFEMQGDLLIIRYSHPLLNANEEYVKTLATRWFVADAENPDLRLPVMVDIMELPSTGSGMEQPVTYAHCIVIDSIKEQFLLIGFEGINASESEEAAIPPLFFLVENKKGASKTLTNAPRLAGNLFTANYNPTRFVMYSTLTVQKINLVADNSLNISFKSIVLTDEKGIEIIVSDLNELFENANLKSSAINGSIEVTFGNAGAQASLGKNAKLQCVFDVENKDVTVNLAVGTELFTEKTATGKYLLLLEDTTNLLQ